MLPRGVPVRSDAGEPLWGRGVEHSLTLVPHHVRQAVMGVGGSVQSDARVMVAVVVNPWWRIRWRCSIATSRSTFVLITAERPRDLPHRSVYVAGYSLGHPVGSDVNVHITLDDIEAWGAVTAGRLSNTPA